MIPIPEPLHPAVVHFPIVLLLLGAPIAVVAAVCRRWHLPVLAAGFLVAGAAGAFVAVATGEDDGGMVGELSASAESLLEEHEFWGETTRTVAVVAALVAVASAALGRFPAVARPAAVVAALLALGAACCVAQTGHRGGQLVYKHGVGINAAAGNQPARAATEPGRGHGEEAGDND